MVNPYEQTHWVCHDCGTCHDTRMEGNLCCELKERDDVVHAKGENNG